MTVEQLHDALTLLPGDLVAEADKRRRKKFDHKPCVIQWQRMAAMAACLALVIFAGRFCMTAFGPKGSSAAMADMVEMAAAPEAMMQSAAIEDVPAEAENGLPEPMAPANRGAGDTGAVSKSTADSALRLAPGVLDTKWVETPAPSAANISGLPSVRALITSREALDAYIEERPMDLAALEDAAALWEENWFESHDLLLLQAAGTEGNTLLDIQEGDGQWTVSVPAPAPGEDTKFYHIFIITEKGLIPSTEAVTIVSK